MQIKRNFFGPNNLNLNSHILITGISGKVGSMCFTSLKNNSDISCEILGTYNATEIKGQKYLDITNSRNIDKIFTEFKPQILIHTAALVHPLKCEQNRKLAWKTNVESVKNLVQKCKEFSCKMVFLSSDSVYEEKNSPLIESDPVIATNYYSKTKIEAEKIVMELEDYLIIRTAWINDVNLHSKSFVMQVLNSLKNNKIFSAPDDYFGHPTLSSNLVEIIIELIIKNKSGIFNVAGLTYIDRYNFALKIADSFNLDSKLIKPVSSENLDTIPRPLRINLNLEKLSSQISTKILSLSEQLTYMKSQNIF